MTPARALRSAALLLALAVAGLCSGGRAAEEERRFVLVIVDGVLWPDYLASGASTLRSLTHTGAVGLMNVRAYSQNSPEAAYLTIGAGSRAAAPPDPMALQVGEGYEAGDAAAAFESRTGVIPPAGGAVYLSIGAAVRANDPQELRYVCRPGLLGSALAEAGITAACVGNADLPGRRRRSVVSAAMDRNGCVPVAVVDSRVVSEAPGFAPGSETGFDALLRAFDRVIADAQFVAVETGDTSRLAAMETELLPRLAEQERRRCILRVDRFLGALTERAAGKPWRIAVVTPSARLDPERTADAMTPIIVAGWQVTPGLLSSPSTRTPGLVANTDLAPTILEFLGSEVPPEATGRAMTMAPRPPGKGLTAILELDRRVAADDWTRTTARDAFKSVVVVALALAALGLLLDYRAPRLLGAVLRGLALCIIAAPLAFLVIAIAPPRTLTGMLIWMAGLSVAIAAVASARRRGWVWVALATGGLIAGDVLLRGGLVSGSVLGYSPAVGARYYGLGNEYGGVLLAAVPLGLLGLVGGPTVRRWQRVLVVAAFALVAVIAGHPGAGANLGIGLACALGFAACVLLLAPGGVPVRRGLAAAIAAAALLALIIIADVLRGGASSHVGRAVAAVAAGGWDALADVIVRRSALNWMLTLRSGWSGPACLGLGVLGVGLVAAPGRVRAALEERPALLAALGGAAVGGVVAHLLNDSGIVSAALALSYAGAALTYIAFSEVEGPSGAN